MGNLSLILTSEFAPGIPIASPGAAPFNYSLLHRCFPTHHYTGTCKTRVTAIGAALCQNWTRTPLPEPERFDVKFDAPNKTFDVGPERTFSILEPEQNM